MAPRSPDAIVIGGGIVGCATAQRLARAGLRVALLERHGICGHTSASSQGHLMVCSEPDLMHRLTSRSVTLWNELHAELGGFDLARTGALYLAEHGDDLELLARLQREFAAHGEATELLDARALREREPALAPDLPGALFYPRDAILLPMPAAARLLRDAVERGASVQPFTPVVSILHEHGRVRGVRTAAGELHAPVVVNCCGVWAPGLGRRAGFGRLPIHPRQGNLAVTGPRTAPIRTQLLEVSYLRVAHGQTTVDPTGREPDPGAHAMNVQPQTHGTCLIGSTRQFVGMRRGVNRALLRHSLQRAARYVPALARATVVRTWTGLRPYTVDKLPIVGAMPECAGLWVAAGHEGLGITLAPVTGELIATAVLAGTAPAELSPARFAGHAHG